MRRWVFGIALTCLAAGCGESSEDFGAPPAPPASGFITNQHIVYSDGLHNENTEMLRLDDRILLVFRGGETAQTGSKRARIKIFASTDNGQTFSLLNQVFAPEDPANPSSGRDIRDPKLVEMGNALFLYGCSRLPASTFRDLFGEAWTVRAASTDSGSTWTTPVKTYADIANGGETFWEFWRFTKRQYTVAGQSKLTLYATGYNDGDVTVDLFASDDGVQWKKIGTILHSYDDVPSEAELQFFGDNNEKAVALVRLDNQDILENGQTAICTSSDPFNTWECGRRIEQRLDGPTWIVRRSGNAIRNFVFARKHLPCTVKRTAAYELRGDLTDPTAPVEVCEIQELKSEGDTAYTALAPLSQDQYLLSWYSNPLGEELPWLEGQFSPSDIWLATVDFSQAPAACVHPEPKRACPSPPLPAGTAVFDVTGQHLLTIGPVFWPAQTISFTADVTVKGSTLDMTLQPLDGTTYVPVGPAWTVTGVPILADGSFTVSFGAQPLPAAAYPFFDDPYLSLGDFTLIGKTTSKDAFCGSVTGYAGVLPGSRVPDRLRLEGSTFGATRITGSTLPAPVISCQ